MPSTNINDFWIKGNRKKKINTFKKTQQTICMWYAQSAGGGELS